MADVVRNRVSDDDWQVIEANITIARAMILETRAGRDAFICRKTNDATDFNNHQDARDNLQRLLVLRLGMSVGLDTTVESAVTQVLNWKDGER